MDNIRNLPGKGNYSMDLNEWLFYRGDIEELDERINHFSYKAGGWRGDPFETVDLFGGKYEWKQVAVPHDWLTEVPVDKNGDSENGYKPRGVGWYYMSLDLSDNEIEDAELVFEGVLGQSTVYVNGTVVGRNFSGYNKFSFDVADYLLPGGKNIIAVYVDARKWEIYCYEGAGIYRRTYLSFKNKNSLKSDKSFIRSEKTKNGWQVVADLSAKNENGMTIRATIKDAEGNRVAEKISETLSLEIPVSDPHLWSPESPYLYKATFELFKEGDLVDELSLQVGFRTIEWRPDEGMYLNGNPYKIKGICCHQDHAGVGAAMTDEIREYRLNILKSLGANAYRCAHNAPEEKLLELCDRMGFLVMVENRHFSVSEEVLTQIDSLVQVSRNHPSVFMYSLYN